MLRLKLFCTSIRVSLMRMVRPVVRVSLSETTRQSSTEVLGSTIKDTEFVSRRKVDLIRFA